MARSCVALHVMTLFLVAMVASMLAASSTGQPGQAVFNIEEPTSAAGGVADGGTLPPEDLGARLGGCLAASGLTSLLFPPPDVEAVTKAIRQRIDGLEQAYNDSDWLTFVSHATNDCHVLIPRRDVIRGRGAWIDSGVFTFMKSIGGVSLTVFIDDVMMSGNDVAVVVGHDRLCAEDGSHVYLGKYVHAWKKIDEVWYMHYLIFNPSK